jgi:DDE superfamily endonuclease
MIGTKIAHVIQIISLPNLWIVDFGYGHMGSVHDSTAWDQMRLAQEHDTILEDGEFVWADSAYPVCHILFQFGCAVCSLHCLAQNVGHFSIQKA